MGGHGLKRGARSSWVCVALLLWALPARAEEAALNWVRLDGAEHCIAATRLAELVESRIGRPVLQPPAHADLSIEARVGPQPDGGWLVVIDVDNRVGRRLGQRELRVAPGPCSELDRPVALVISLIIDPNAAGPGLMENGALSPDAQRLLGEIELPSADPDALLASLAFTQPHRAPASAPESVPVPSGAADKRAPKTPPAKMVSVPEAEWLRMQALVPTQTPRHEGGAGTPAWPGYALLGLGAVAAGVAVYAVVRVNALESDSGFQSYRLAASRSNPQSHDVCVDARAGLAYGPVGASTPAHAASVCDAGALMQVLFWVFASTAVASATVGGAWLLWVADDGTSSSAKEVATLSLMPAASPTFSGLQLRLHI